MIASTRASSRNAWPTTRAAPHDEVEDARRQAAAARDLGERPRRARHEIRGLEDHAVAVGERRRDLPGRNRDGKVPRRDRGHDADRLARHLDVQAGAHGGELLARDAQRLAGEELEDLPGAADLADRLGKRLALLAGEQVAQLRLAGEDFRADEVERVGARLRRGHRPLRERRARGGDGGARLGIPGAGVFVDHVRRVRRDSRSGRRLRPPPTRRRSSCVSWWLFPMR